jgi:hypothetical protein
VLAAFVGAGALAGLGGMLFAARFGTVDATAGSGYELTVIAGAVVGGVAIFGGVGSVYGAALGALLLGTITSALIVLRVDAFWQQAAIGALLLAAIAFDRSVGSDSTPPCDRGARAVQADDDVRHRRRPRRGPAAGGAPAGRGSARPPRGGGALLRWEGLLLGLLVSPPSRARACRPSSSPPTPSPPRRSTCPRSRSWRCRWRS